MYSKKVLEHFRNPQNAHRMLDANGESTVGDPSCGDSLRMFIKVENSVIKKISYLVFGCCAAVATSSITSVLAKGKTLEEALKIKEQDVIDALDGLPEEKKHCSNLGVSALKLAIQDYEEKRTKTKIQKIQMCISKHYYFIKDKIVNYMMYRLYKR
ncbi:iron-sulfur cluster assembly scaffold protein [Clostridium sp. PL3]|uniref:Iron-sulfur cluster assembly scaffold protein n=1 Tax=Clostridium thailandense TaxID=2794346 RepID=A0A949TX28_9CLOT|nr:iron-sulfur cluster assembly scaffold protein [Clostridium thailandense]